MDKKTFYSAEDFLSKLAQSSDEDFSLGESDDSEDGDILLDGPSESIIHCHSPNSSDEERISITSQQPEKRFKLADSPNSAPLSVQNKTKQTVRRRSKKKCRKTQASPVVTPTTPGHKWNNSTDDDITPQETVFRPFRTPGPQLAPTESYTVLQLFQLFISSSMLQTIVRHTNANAARRQSNQKPWKDISLKDMYSYLSLVIYMGLIKVCTLTDYWRKSRIFSVPYPAQVMSSRKYFAISSALHLSDPQVDGENQKKKGTAAYDRLCKIKPMYDQLREACKNNFHPFQNIAINERMVATKARNGLKQHMKGKPAKCGYKLFVLADSLCAYTWDFFIYQGKSPAALVPHDKGLSYESVMELVDVQMLGTGYKLFVDSFYTSPVLFRDLLQKNIFACGTIRSNITGYPKTTKNKLPKKAPRGTHHWLREGSLLFVEWKDTREVQMCSTIHRGTGGSTVQRKIKGNKGQQRTTFDVPVPDCVVEYNRCMGGVDVSDALIGYYTVSHKTRKWYRSFFYHFVDIAIVNAYIVHRQMACARDQKPMTQKQFREKLVEELAGSVLPDNPPPPPQDTRHLPGYIASDSTKGRRQCRVCAKKTPVYCTACSVSVCFQPKRDCFTVWHNQQDQT